MASMCWCRWCVLARLFAHRPRCRRVRPIKSGILLGLRGVRMRGVSTGRRRRRRGKAIEAVHCCRPVVPLAFLCCDVVPVACAVVRFLRCCKSTVRTKQRAFRCVSKSPSCVRPTADRPRGGWWWCDFLHHIFTRCRDSLYSWAAVAAS